MRKALNLQLGWPSTSLHPRVALLQATQATLGNEELAAAALVYGPDPGYQPLRKSIAEWLSSFYRPSSGQTHRSRIFIANGASTGLSIILDKFTDPVFTQRIWMVEPTYFLACSIFEDAGFVGRLRGVPEDEEGIDIEFLRRELESVAKEMDNSKTPNPVKYGSRYPKLYRHVIYAVPTFCNPSAKTMSMRRRRELVEVAREYDALIITDDVYDMLRWPAQRTEQQANELGPPPPRLTDVDRAMNFQDTWGNAVSNGSFSKLIGPGIRVSWIEGTPAFVDDLAKHGATASGGSPGHMASVFVHSLLQSGSLDEHIDSVLCPTYRSRSRVMADAIKEHLEPLGVRVTVGKPFKWNTSEDGPLEVGGFFTFVTLPERFPPADEVAKVALKHYSLKIAPGQIMAVRGDRGSIDRSRTSFGRGIRLSWSWHNEEDIKEGVARLAEVLKDMQAGTVSESSNGTEPAAELSYK